MFGHASFSETAFSDVGAITITTTPSFRQIVFVSQELPRKVLIQRKVSHVVVIPRQESKTVSVEKQEKREVMVAEDIKRKLAEKKGKTDGKIDPSKTPSF